MLLARLIFLLSSLSHKEAKARHTERSVVSFFVHKLPKGNIPQSNEPCHSSLSYVFRALRNSLGYPHYVRITHVQTVLTLFPKNSRALTVLFNGAGWFLKLLLLSIFHSKWILSKTTALSKSQATAAERRGKECECFLARCKRGQTSHSRDYQG